MSPLYYLEQVGHFVHFAVCAAASAARAFSRPRDLLVQLHQILIGALPLGIITGFALGIVVWIHFHGAIPRQYVHKVPEYLALAVVVEAAPLSAGLLLAGRTGASLGAELGAMRQSEQLDALVVLGQLPMRKLVGPRVLACMLALPVLTVFIAFVSIGGSYVAEMTGGTLSWTQYQNDCLRSLTMARIIPSTMKTVAFGYLVATTGCFFGMNATGGTEGVGRAATRGVVVSIFLVMVSNVALVQFIQLLFS